MTGTITTHHPFSDEVAQQFRALEYDDPDQRNSQSRDYRLRIWENKVLQIYQRCGTGHFTIRDIEDIGKGGGFVAGLVRGGYIQKIRKIPSEGIYVWILTPKGVTTGEEGVQR